VMYELMEEMQPDWQKHMEFFRSEEAKLYKRVFESVASKAGFTIKASV
jgi:hypothetical protein